MDTFDLCKARRVLNDHTIDTSPDYSDDFHPFANQDLSFLDTPEKRKEHFQEFFARKGLRRTGSISCPLHLNYTIGCIEREVEIKQNKCAETIQKWVRGMLTRSKYGVHNPNCEFGQIFVRWFLSH